MSLVLPVPDGSPHDPARVLADLGWDDARSEDFAPHAAQGRLPGRIARADRGAYTVLTGSGRLRAGLPGRLRHEATAAADLPAVGDWVAVRAPDGDGPGIVEAVLERRGAFVRKAAGEVTDAQVLAANVDVALIVASLAVPISPRRLERYLAVAWESGATPVVVLTKADLAADVPAAVAQAEAVAFGVPVLPVSAVRGDGLEALEPHLGAGRTLVLLGLSGVGKSTLANHLAGADLLRVQDIRDDGKGRHTTTHRELVPLPAGGLLIDTPGMRELGLWDAEEGVGHAFADIEELAAACRFADCGHAGEPGCAVRDAIGRGSLPAERFESWRKLQRELRALAVRQDQRLQSEQRRHHRNLNRAMRVRNRAKRRDR